MAIAGAPPAEPLIPFDSLETSENRVDIAFSADEGGRFRVRQYFPGEPIPREPDDLLIPCGSFSILVRVIGLRGD